MRDVKKKLKTLKNENENEKKIFTDNPFVLAVVVFLVAILVNFLLELEFTKSLFKWSEYYFNSSLFWLNSNLQSAFKDHPYIHISILSNPVTSEFMAIINPWMWLRGFIISSFFVGQIITVLNIKIIKSKNIVIAVILMGLLQLGMYAFPYGAAISFPILILVTQKFYINILALMFVCLVGLLSGVEYAVSLFRNKKINVASKTDGPGINIKFTDKLDW